ncbi:MAG TPA: alpha/beta hydrolase [Burkholderiaceae bacterium]|jgi:pimeloyl-ACP methyl ester carboxylesterase
MTITDPHAAAFIDELDREAERHDVPVDGGHVTWRRFGDGPPLVLLHGGHGRWTHWARNIRPLAAHASVWVPDLPGYGDSSTPPATTHEALVDATRQSLDALVGTGTPIHLAGFSFGGLTAAALAARRGHVARLGLFGPGGHGGARRPRGALKVWRDAADSGDAAALAEVMRHNLLMHMLHDPASVDALAMRIHTEACLATRFRSRTISLAGGLARWLAQYPGPLLLAWGEHDVTAVPEDALRAMAQGRSDCRTVLVRGAGHWLQYERADQANELLLSLLAARA